MKQLIILALLLTNCSPLANPPRKIKPVIKGTYTANYVNEITSQAEYVFDNGEILYNGQVFCPSLKCKE